MARLKMAIMICMRGAMAYDFVGFFKHLSVQSRTVYLSHEWLWRISTGISRYDMKYDKLPRNIKEWAK